MTLSRVPFPDYLGYGIQEKDSYDFDADKGIHRCRYQLNGITIMEAKVSEREAVISEIVEGSVRGIASGENLEKAMFSYYQKDECITNPIYLAWLRQVIDAGNIYAEVFDRAAIRFLFYPTLYYTTIHIPLKPEKEAIARSIACREAYNFFTPWIQQALMYTTKSGRTGSVDLFLLSLISPVAHVPWLLRVLLREGIISEEKKYRAIVGATEFHYSKSIKNFRGDESDGWSSYSIEYWPLPPRLMQQSA